MLRKLLNLPKAKPCHCIYTRLYQTGNKPAAPEFLGVLDRYSNMRGGKEKRASYKPSGSDRRWENGRDPRRQNNRNSLENLTNISSCSEKTQMALKQVLADLKKVSPTLKVNQVDSETGKLNVCHVLDIAKKLDFKAQGLHVIQPGPHQRYPIIKVIPAVDMIRSFSDSLAAAKQKELLASGSAKAERSAMNKLQAERKKQAVKVLTISWSISTSDLANQKKKEVEKRLAKDDTLIVYIGEKQSLVSARKGASKSDGILGLIDSSHSTLRRNSDQHEVELRRRELLIETLRGAFEELELKVEESGLLESRMMFKVTRKASASQPEKSTKKQNGELSAKELRKLKRDQLARERAELALAKKYERDNGLDSDEQDEISELSKQFLLKD